MIPRLQCGDATITSFVEKCLPVIIEGALDEWNLSECWTPRALSCHLQDAETTLCVSDDGRYYLNTDGGLLFRRIDTTFSAAATRILNETASESTYVMQESIPDTYPQLMNHLSPPRWITGETVALNLWFGRRTSTPLHFDPSDNFYAQAFGEKSFIVFSPIDSAYLYPHDHTAGCPHVSPVDPQSWKSDEFGDFCKASPISFTLAAGDLLFLPAFWWHQVMSVGTSVSVNFWVSAKLDQLLEAPNSSLLFWTEFLKDRLGGIYNRLLKPNGLNLDAAVSLFREKGALWTACLIEFASIDYEFKRILGGVTSDASSEAFACELKDNLESVERDKPYIREYHHDVVDLAKRVCIGDKQRVDDRDIVLLQRFKRALRRRKCVDKGARKEMRPSVE